MTPVISQTAASVESTCATAGSFYTFGEASSSVCPGNSWASVQDLLAGTCLNINLLKPSGHYMHRTVVTIRTAQWSLCTGQWSLYVPHSGHYMHCSGHYMHRTVVTICTAQWSLYVPHSGHYMHRTTFSPHGVFVCFVWISEQTAIISL
jgi:hypothetical protein